MKNINKTPNFGPFLAITIVLIVSILSVTPTPANAFDAGRLIDPLCLFACEDHNDRPQNVTTYTNSNNVNSNVNSPGATVNAGNTSSVRTSPTPVIAYNTPVYNYDYYYNQYPTNNYGPLQVSCYPMPLSARTGDSVSWVASAYGGNNNSYYYTWTGTDGLSGYGSSVSKTYYSTGYKNASVTVTSGNQTVSKNCDGTVNIYADTYYTPPTYPYYPPTYTYYPLNVTCSVNNSYSNYNNSVTWTAYPTGGSGGSYSYTWSGTDGLYGSGQSIYYSYSYPGQKTASVTVYSGGQSVTRNCGYVNVGDYQYQYVNSYYNYSNVNSNIGLDVACYVDPTTARVNQPATWRAEVTGGIAPYTYSWTGTNGLSGSDSTLIKYYDTVGEKSAVVTIRSANGLSATRACSTSLTVRAAASVLAPTPPAPTLIPAPQPENNLSAAALFSLKNVPWGWVAILVILVLFATVVYLIFNRPKI